MQDHGGDEKPDGSNCVLTCSRLVKIMVALGSLSIFTLQITLRISMDDMVSPRAENMQLKSSLTGREQRYIWNDDENKSAFSSFLWVFIVIQFAVARCAEIMGPVRVIGGCVICASVLTLISPVLATAGVTWLLTARVIIGNTLAATPSAFQVVAARWVGPHGRSRFIALLMLPTLGAAFIVPLFRFVIYRFGWQYVFTISGCLGFGWAVCWIIFIFDSPSQHPTISAFEQVLIKVDQKYARVSDEGMIVPWRFLLSSAAVWAIIATHVLFQLNQSILNNEVLNYLQKVHHLNINSVYFVTLVPICEYIIIYGSATLVDMAIEKTQASTGSIRKYCTFTVLGIPSCLMLGMHYSVNSSAVSVFLYAVTICFNGAVAGGHLSNALDIAPNFAGTIFGIANTLSASACIASTYVLDAVTENSDNSPWGSVFGTLCITYFVGSFIFTGFGSGHLRRWQNSTYKGPEGTADAEALKHSSRSVCSI